MRVRTYVRNLSNARVHRCSLHVRFGLDLEYIVRALVQSRQAASDYMYVRTLVGGWASPSHHEKKNYHDGDPDHKNLLLNLISHESL